MNTRGLSLNGVVAQTKALVLVALGALIIPAQAQQAVGQIELLKDVYPGVSPNSTLHLGSMAAGGDRLYLNTLGQEQLYGYELHAIDPQQKTLTRLNDLYPGTGGSSPEEMTWLDGRLYFRGHAPEIGSELFSYDSVSGETQLVADILPQEGQSSSPQQLTVFEGKLYFTATTPVNFRRNVFVYDPAQPSQPPQQLTNFTIDNAQRLTASASTLWLAGTKSPQEIFLQRLDAGQSSFTEVTLSGTQGVLDSTSVTGPMAVDGNRVAVVTSSGTFGAEVMMIDVDGTTGSAFVHDYRAGYNSSSPQHPSFVNGALYWVGYNGSQWQVLKLTNSIEVLDTAVNQSYDQLVLLGSSIYMSRFTAEGGREPWLLDTTSDEFVQLADINVGTDSSSPAHFTLFNELVYFSAIHPDTGRQIYVYDPQTQQVDLVANFVQFPFSSFPEYPSIGQDYSAFAARLSGQYVSTEPGQPQLQQLPGKLEPQTFVVPKPPIPPNPVVIEADSAADSLNQVNENYQQVMLINHATNSLQQITAFEAPTAEQQTLVRGVVQRDNSIIYNTVVSGQSGFKVYSYDLTSGNTTEIFSANDGGINQLFESNGLVLFSSYSSTNNQWAPYIIDMQGNVVSLNDMTSGDDIGYVWDIDYFNGFYLLQAYDLAAQTYWLYVYDPFMHRIIRAVDAESFGGSPNDTYLWTQVLHVSSTYMIIYAQTQSGTVGLYKFLFDGTVTAIEAFNGQYIYAATEHQGKLVVRNQSSGLTVYDYDTQIATPTDSSAFTDFYYVHENFFTLDGRLVFTANTREYGYTELFTLNFDTMTVELIGELNAGPRNSNLFMLGVSGNQLILRGVSDAYGVELYSFTFNNAPVISGTPATTVAQDQAYSFTPTATDADNETLTFSITGKPAWASFSTSTGALTGTPGNSDVGVHNDIVISVTDGKATSSLPAFSITVTNVNDAPTISGTPATSVLQDQLYSFQAIGADIDVGDELTYSSTALPLWLSLNAQTGLLSGTPGNADVGATPPIVISVSDGELTASLPAFAITVINVNDAPVISGIPATSVLQDQAYSFIPSASDPDFGDVLVFSIVNKPTWAAFNTQTGALTGTPGNADVGVTSGIVISVSDGFLSAALPAFALTVVNVNDAPVISGVPATSVLQDEAYSFVPSASDIDVGDVLTFSIVNKPTWAAFNTQTGALTGTPGNDDVGVTSGIVIAVSDGELSAALPAFTLTVVNVNDAPVIFGEPVTSVNQDQLYLFEPTADDMDVGDSLTGFITGKPDWLTFDTATGILTGTPSNDDVGVYENIVIGVRDLAGATDTLDPFSITVVNVNDAPMITNTPLLTLLDGQAYSYIPEVSDPDTAVDPEESFTFSAENVPTWLTFSDADGSLTGTPTPEDIGEWTAITITVTDRDGLSDSVGPFTITVDASNRAPEAVDDRYTMDNSAPQLLVKPMENDSDPDGDTLKIVGAKRLSGPASIELLSSFDSATSAEVADTVKVTLLEQGYVGEITFTYTITDPSGERASAVATVTVSGGSNVITLTPPADVTVHATGPLTAVDLGGTATAIDSQGNSTISVTVSGQRDGYEPGLHTVTWSAGSGSNKVSKAQTIRVIPQVSLVSDLQFEMFADVKVPVILSGPAPEYPFRAAIQVDSNIASEGGVYDAVFTSGTRTEVTLPSFTAGSQSRVVSIANGVNAGDKVSITLSSPAPATFAVPMLESAGVSTTTVFPGDRVAVFVKVSGGDPNQWTIRITVVNAKNGLRRSSTVIVPDETGQATARVQAGNKGRWRIEVTARNGQNTVGSASFPLRIRTGDVSNGGDAMIAAFEYNPNDDDLSRELDQNGNGFVDYEDGRWDYDSNGIVAYLDRSLSSANIWTGNAYAQTTLAQRIVSMVDDIDEPDSIRTKVTPDSDDSGDIPIILSADGNVLQVQRVDHGSAARVQVGLDVSNYRFVGDFYAFNLSNLLSFGATAQVALPLDQPLGAGSELLLWQADAWRTFEVGAGGSVFSAGSVFGVCPAVDSTAWQPGLNQGDWCVRLDIVDGGVNDTDGEVSAEVLVFGGVAINDAGNTPPVAVADSAVAVWRGSVSIPVLTNDTDADGDALSIVSASADIGTVTVNAARTVLQFVSPGDFAGVATITYVVTDNNGGMAVGTATVTVLENRAPVLGADSAVTVAGRPMTVNVLANDADPDGDSLSITAVSVAAASGTASYSGSSVTFVPAAGFVGVATVSYSVSDNRGGTATGTLTVQVAAAPEVIQVRPATGSFWWFLTVGGLLLAWRRRSA